MNFVLRFLGGLLTNQLSERAELGKAGSKASRIARGGAGQAGEAVRHAVLNPIQTTYSAGWALDAVKNLGASDAPSQSSSITVKIWGNNNADMSRLYYLAIAICNANMPTDNLMPASKSFVSAVLPHAKYVEVTLAISRGGFLGQFVGNFADLQAPFPSPFYATNQWPAFMVRTDQKEQRPMLTDPFGNPLPVSQNANGQPINASVAQVMGRYTNDGQNTYTNPFPIADGISRTTDFTEIFAAALLGPCDTVYQPQTFEYTTTGDLVKDQTAVLGYPYFRETFVSPNSLSATTPTVNSSDQLVLITGLPVSETQNPGGS